MALTTVPASLSATALTLTTAAQPNITSVGTLTGLTVSGNIAGTLTTAAQTNITSVGTLSSLSVGAITSTGKLTLNDSTYAGWIQSNGSVRIDIDNDNNQTDRAFVVSKNNGATSLLTLSEDASATFAGTLASLDATFTASSAGAAGLNIKRSSSSGRAQITLQDESGNNLWRIGATAPGTTDFAFFDGSDNVLVLSTNNSATFAGDLTTSGFAKADNYQFYQNSAATGVTDAIYRKTTATLAFKTGSTERMTLNGSGDLALTGGITTSGSVGFRTAADSNYAFVAMQNGSLTHGGYMSIQGATATGLEINSSASSSFSGTVLLAKQSQRTSGGYLARFANSAGDQMVVETGGNVGIGTATPQKKLHIEHAAGASEGILISGASDTAGHTAGILLRAEGGESDSDLRAKGGIFFERTGTFGVGKLHLANDLGADNTSATISDAKLTIDENGDVGIGTTTPDEFGVGSSYRYLAVGGSTIPGIINLVDSSTTGSYLQFGTAAGLRRASIHAVNGSHLAFTVNNSNSGTTLAEAMRISNIGNVIINKANFSSLPTGSKLNIFGDGTTLRLDGSSATTKSILFRNVNAGNPGEVYADGSLRFRTEDASTFISFHTNSSGSNNERMRINTNGSITVGGGGTPRSVGWGDTKLQIEGTGATDSSISIIRNEAGNNPPYLVLGKSRGSSIGSSTVVQNNDDLGTIRWVAADGAGLENQAAQISAQVDGTPGNNDTPGRLMFFTSPDGSNSAQERMRIDSSGDVSALTGAFTQNPVNWYDGNLLRRLSISGPNSSGTFIRTINVSTQLKFLAHGGAFMYMLHGWMADRAAGMVSWRNPGNSSQVISDVYQDVLFSPSGITVTASKGSGDLEIDLSIASAHSNSHGWYFVIWW